MKRNRKTGGKRGVALSLFMMAAMLAGCSTNGEWGAVVFGAGVESEERMNVSVQAEPADSMPPVVLAAASASPQVSASAVPAEPSPQPTAEPAAGPQPSAGDSQTKTTAAATQKRKWIALTFDDGPDNKYTPQVLDILKQYDVKATFFLVGTQVEKAPETVRRIAAEGHDIGNHSWSHKDLSKMTAKQLEQEIARTQSAIAKAAGVTPDLVRAPYGSLSDTLLQYLSGKHFHHVYWTVDPKDWDGASVASMRENIRKHAHPGGIILLHSFGGRKDALDHTLKLLPLVIEDLRKAGYEFRTVDEMIDAKQVSASVVK